MRRARRAVPLRLIPRLHLATHRLGLEIAGWPELGVTQAEAHVLDHLATMGSSTVGTLHDAFAHRRSTLTSVLDRLVERALVRRDSSPEDRRTFVVRLTPAGQQVAHRVHDRLQAIEARARAAVSPRDVQGFDRVLAALAAGKK